MRSITAILSASLCFAGSSCSKKSDSASQPGPNPSETPVSENPLPLDDAGENPSATPTEPVVPPADTPAPEPAPEPVPEPVPPPTELRIKEAQFWVYSKNDEGQLVFNTPWDEEEGDGIIRDENDSSLPRYAKNCFKEAKSFYESLAQSKDFQRRIQPLLAAWATPELTFLVVSTEEDDREALRKIDRDAYFWHWTDGAKKPVVSLSQYQKGTWVWEVIATPKTCIQPSLREMGRMLDWAKRRLDEKGANP